MPSKNAELIKHTLANREKITEPAKILEFAVELFKLALEDLNNSDCEAADALFMESNRFAVALEQVIPKEQLEKFHTLLKKVRDKKKLHEFFKKMYGANPNPSPANAEVQMLAPAALIHSPPPENLARTILAEKNPRVVTINNKKGIMHESEFVPMVTRTDRDFTTKLCSIGDISREEILLDPNESELQDSYEKLKQRLSSGSETKDILEVVKGFTKELFPSDKPDYFINKVFNTGRKIITLGEFIKKGEGVCRHHAFLNAYLLSRLVQDGILKGEVIHHRQKLPMIGAHAWNIFHDQNGKVYSLDSFWGNVTCVTDNPGAINTLYGSDVESLIYTRHFNDLPRDALVPFEGAEPPAIPAEPPVTSAELSVVPAEPPAVLAEAPAVPAEAPAVPAEPPAVPAEPPAVPAEAKIKAIKIQIESTQFSVGDYKLFKGGLMLKLDDGSLKRVPHRVYEIYRAVIANSNNATLDDDALWKKIQGIAQKALDHPKPGRDATKTTPFYASIVNDNVQLPDVEHNILDKAP